AFSKAKNAETTAKRLVQAGFKNVVYQKTSKVTRVIILDVPTDEVQDNLDKLAKNGFTDHLVQEHINSSTNN
ncbi:MAG: SPOR domain-containing protein, partial [Treponema sp.]|nr:SPOR domain-containing protein [Treponema sp.]